MGVETVPQEEEEHAPNADHIVMFPDIHLQDDSIESKFGAAPPATLISQFIGVETIP